jgi:hypothetical protein
MAEVASWPATVLPQLQHIGFAPDEHIPDLSPLYNQLLAHLPQLITNRPLHPFYVHLFNQTSDEYANNPEPAVLKACEEFHLPCVRLSVIDDTAPGSGDINLTKKMEASTDAVTVSKAELLQLVQAEQRRVCPTTADGADSA